MNLYETCIPPKDAFLQQSVASREPVAAFPLGPRTLSFIERAAASRCVTMPYCNKNQIATAPLFQVNIFDRRDAGDLVANAENQASRSANFRSVPG
ncbi:hypothetical protein QO002_004226 [Pararhizobium capsulatum DSM 1112]|uniref:Uncharacterized protein n=1 Tax=Pararhizobium capsulatum DSM 1112 TaxID=1121113 RepID=A0ABU0BUU8_9HYPH|nr:hypothetical protein [Pararhizobium capsulatum]MDQ0322020.1 hypothetical protein [Pararhizobium capsulatum DSM 1112]